MSRPPLPFPNTPDSGPSQESSRPLFLCPFSGYDWKPEITVSVLALILPSWNEKPILMNCAGIFAAPTNNVRVELSSGSGMQHATLTCSWNRVLPNSPGLQGGANLLISYYRGLLVLHGNSGSVSFSAVDVTQLGPDGLPAISCFRFSWDTALMSVSSDDPVPPQ